MPRTCMQKILVLIAFLLCPLAGCGQSLPATVSGTVTLDGQDLPEGPRVAGSVIYYPIGGGAAAYGTVTSGGKYNMQTGKTNGLQLGEYLVTVRVVDIAPPPPGGYNNPPASRTVIPLRYKDRQRSDLQVQVGQGGNEIDLQLTSSKSR